ncbi:uncharacterized protein METZ01_LOCUS325483 [marine metagenome]|uniref:Uncharacterized protein n=1 Tax=marine metagenome TaxID=408172 RepID=A0A382PGV3_9ZZZZ
MRVRHSQGEFEYIIARVLLVFANKVFGV